MTSFATATGAAKLIANNPAILNAVGLTSEEYELILQEDQWTGAQRKQVTFAMKTICFPVTISWGAGCSVHC